MAHRSRKKHIKHVHQHEPPTPPAKSPAEKAEAAAAGFARKGRSKIKSAGRTAGKAKGKTKNQQRAADVKNGAKVVRAKATGLVRRVARKAAKKIVERPRRILSRARARVGSLVG